MRNRYLTCFYILLFLFSLTGCKSAIKEREDRIYSRHLQRHVDLTIISTRMPDDKSDMNLLLFNNAGDLQEMNAKKIIDSLYSKKLIQPVELVAIHGNYEQEYGMSDLAAPGNTGGKADKYNSFVMNELYPFIKKKSSIRKFRSIAICGNSLAGISAFDIAWQHADKIDKVGIFSGDFTYAANGVLEKISSSRKRPKLQYWFYAAENKDSSILNNTKELVNIINKKNTGTSTSIKFVPDKTGSNHLISWRQHFPEFLIWAFGK